MIYIDGKRKYMRIGLFGISRSGKNYTIDDFNLEANKYGRSFVHLSPMDMIRDRLNGRRLKDMSDEEKRALVKKVRDQIDQIAEDHDVIVDEHYCYPVSFGGVKPENGYFDEKLPHDIWHRDYKDLEYEVVFPRFEADKYDVIAVMQIDPKIIVERCRTSEGAKYNPYITEEDAKEWQKAELLGIWHDSHKSIIEVVDPKNSGKELWKGYSSQEFEMTLRGDFFGNVMHIPDEIRTRKEGKRELME